MTNTLSRKPHATVAWATAVDPLTFSAHDQETLLADAKDRLETTASKEGRKLAGDITITTQDSMLMADGSPYAPPPGVTYVVFKSDTVPA